MMSKGVPLNAALASPNDTAIVTSHNSALLRTMWIKELPVYFVVFNVKHSYRFVHGVSLMVQYRSMVRIVSKNWR